MDPTTILGDTSSKGILRRAADFVAGLLPWGIGAMGLTYLFDSAGGEDSFLKKLEGIPLVGTAVKFLSDMASKLVNWVSGMFTSKETTTMNTAIAERLDADKGFELAEKALGIPGIGAELRDMAKKAATKGGSPNDNARKLHQEQVAFIVDKWQDVNPTGDPTNISKLAEDVVTGLVGVADQDQLPRVVTQGYAGLLHQAKKAKDAEGDLSADEVKPINISPELKALAEAAATPNATPAPETEASAPVAPPKSPRMSALAAAAGK